MVVYRIALFSFEWFHAEQFAHLIFTLFWYWDVRICVEAPEPFIRLCFCRFPLIHITCVMLQTTLCVLHCSNIHELRYEVMPRKRSSDFASRDSLDKIVHRDSFQVTEKSQSVWLASTISTSMKTDDQSVVWSGSIDNEKYLQYSIQSFPRVAKCIE